jgi:hypothetical protein
MRAAPAQIKNLIFNYFVFTHRAYHQTDMSPYSCFLLVDAVAVIAVLALAFHWSCQFRKVE